MRIGEISVHFAEIYVASVPKETISRITDKMLEEVSEWQNQPLDEVYAAILNDAGVVKIDDGQVANRPIYSAIGVTLDGRRTSWVCGLAPVKKVRSSS